MAGNRAYRPTVCDNQLEDRVVLSHTGTAAAIAELRHALIHHPVVVHHAVKPHPTPHAAKHATGKKGVATQTTPPVTTATYNIAYTPPPSTTTTTTTTAPTSTPTISGTITPTVSPSDPPPSNPPAPLAAQGLSATGMSSAQFNSLFQALGTAPAMTSTFHSLDGSSSGVVQSEAFQGTGAASGLYAYAYQIDVSSGQINLQNVSMKFGAAPVATNLTGSGQGDNVYVIQNGAVGGLNAPSGPATAPTQLSWQPNATAANSVLSASFNTTAQAGSTTATFVVISNQPVGQQFINIAGTDPSYMTSVYVPV